MSNFEVLIINLKRSVKRREAMTRSMQHVKAPWRFLEAVDGKTLSEKELSSSVTCWSRFLLGRKLVPNEIGCYLSHLQASKILLESSMDFVIVLEDDCSVTPEFDTACDLLSKIDGWDIIRLEKRHDKVFTKSLQIPDEYDFNLKRVDWALYGAVGYAVSREGAEKIVSSSHRITWPFDILFTRYWAHGLRYYALEKPVIIWNEQVTSIIGQETGGRVNASKYTCQYICKRMRMIYDGLMRRLYRTLIRSGLK